VRIFFIGLLLFGLPAFAGDPSPTFRSHIISPSETNVVDVTNSLDGTWRLHVDSYVRNPGGVPTFPQPIGDQFIEFLENTGSKDLLVDGSSTPVDFKVLAHATKDKNITEIRCTGGTTGSLKFSQFLKFSTKLTNGVEIKILSDAKTFTFPLIKSTEDFRDFVSFKCAQNWLFDITAAQDRIRASFCPSQPFPLIKNTADYVQVKIQDDLTATGGAADDLSCLVLGFYSE
jgi:hypothetical protein